MKMKGRNIEIRKVKYVPKEENIPKKVEEGRGIKGKKNKKGRNTKYIFCLYILT
jgi:hypothetical protein